jgi:hypothetical protein
MKLGSARAHTSGDALYVTICRRAALSLAACAVAFGMATAASRAALDFVVGARTVVKNEPVSNCNAQARKTLDAVLQDAAEVGSGDTGEWRAYGAPDASGHTSAAAAIHCYPLDNGYLVTFTCAVQVPPNPDSASALCAKLAGAFGAKTEALTSPSRAGRPR